MVIKNAALMMALLLAISSAKAGEKTRVTHEGAENDSKMKLHQSVKWKGILLVISGTEGVDPSGILVVQPYASVQFRALPSHVSGVNAEGSAIEWTWSGPPFGRLEGLERITSVGAIQQDVHFESEGRYVVTATLLCNGESAYRDSLVVLAKQLEQISLMPSSLSISHQATIFDRPVLKVSASCNAVFPRGLTGSSLVSGFVERRDDNEEVYLFAYPTQREELTTIELQGTLLPGTNRLWVQLTGGSRFCSRTEFDVTLRRYSSVVALLNAGPEQTSGGLDVYLTQSIGVQALISMYHPFTINALPVVQMRCHWDWYIDNAIIFSPTILFSNFNVATGEEKIAIGYGASLRYRIAEVTSIELGADVFNVFAARGPKVEPRIGLSFDFAALMQMPP
jgi:hypothetical protein